MAEKQQADLREGCEDLSINDIQSKVNPVGQKKRCSSTSPDSAPPQKSPRTDSLSSSTQRTNTEKQSETDMQKMLMEDTGKLMSPTAETKSWRRTTITRRSLSAPPNPYQALCSGISTSLSNQERLEKLLEASVKLALERTQNMLLSVPQASIETFKKQVEYIQAQGSSLATSIPNDSHKLQSIQPSEPTMQKAMKNVQKAIERLSSESESWDVLLTKHQRKAEELEQKLQRGQETGIQLNSTSMSQSSQYPLIQSKPDYHSILSRQRPMIHTMATIIDTQCKIVRQLLSIKEQSQLFVKETSGRLAEEAGFQDLSSDLLRNLMSAPLPTAST
ncbi:kinetochore-associated protein DSN1 homolog [Nothobranchius furzeri]|uniref:DSN1, MIND kinetochore complex component, homolog n=4 Tax=Nothobranchius TaxID=28779 RepID=A0A1A8B8G3_NOTFU|nr:kinetochore-associated protein DSN1 homolog [Nothobranchius furzeri]KAF7225568.1 putative LOC107378326-like protein [Nothobranchius furzeri]